jgi:hypothetical protein
MVKEQDKPNSAAITSPSDGEIIPVSSQKHVEELGNGRVKVTLTDGRVVFGVRRPDGRIGRGPT